MEKKIKITPVYKTIQNGSLASDVFVAYDGKEFEGKNAEKDCLAYEEQLKLNEEFFRIATVPTFFYLSMCDLPDTYFVASTERELELIKNYLSYDAKFADIEVNQKTKGNNDFVELKVGDAIGLVKDDGGDYRPTFYFYTLDYIRKQFKEFLVETEM